MTLLGEKGTEDHKNLHHITQLDHHPGAASALPFGSMLSFTKDGMIDNSRCLTEAALTIVMQHTLLCDVTWPLDGLPSRLVQLQKRIVAEAPQPRSFTSLKNTKTIIEDQLLNDPIVFQRKFLDHMSYLMISFIETNRSNNDDDDKSGLLPIVQERYWLPVILLFQFQAWTSLQNLNKYYDDLKKVVGNLFNKQQTHWTGKVSLIVYHLQASIYWKTIRNEIEAVLQSFALLPIAMEQSLTAFGDIDAMRSFETWFDRIDIFTDACEVQIYPLHDNVRSTLKSMEELIRQMDPTTSQSCDSAEQEEDINHVWHNNADHLHYEFQLSRERLKFEYFPACEDHLNHILSNLMFNITPLPKVFDEKNKKQIISIKTRDILIENRWIHSVCDLLHHQHCTNMGKGRRLCFGKSGIDLCTTSDYKDDFAIALNQKLLKKYSSRYEIISAYTNMEHTHYAEFVFQYGGEKISKSIRRAKLAGYELLAITNQLQNEFAHALKHLELRGDNHGNIYHNINRSLVWLRMKKVHMIEDYTRFMSDFILYYHAEVREESRTNNYLAYAQIFEDGLTCYRDLINTLVIREELTLTNQDVFDPSPEAIYFRPILRYCLGPNVSSSFQLKLALSLAYQSMQPNEYWKYSRFTKRTAAVADRWTLFEQGIKHLHKAISIVGDTRECSDTSDISSCKRDEIFTLEVTGWCCLKNAEQFSAKIYSEWHIEDVFQDCKSISHVAHLNVASNMEKYHKGQLEIYVVLSSCSLNNDIQNKLLAFNGKYYKLKMLVEYGKLQTASILSFIDGEKGGHISPQPEVLKTTTGGKSDDIVENINNGLSSEEVRVARKEFFQLVEGTLLWIGPLLEGEVSRLVDTILNQSNHSLTHFQFFSAYFDLLETLLQLHSLYIDICEVVPELRDLYWYESTTFSRKQCLIRSNKLIAENMTFIQEVNEIVMEISATENLEKFIDFLFAPVLQNNTIDLLQSISSAQRKAADDIVTVTEMFRKELEAAQSCHFSRSFESWRLQPPTGIMLCR